MLGLKTTRSPGNQHASHLVINQTACCCYFPSGAWLSSMLYSITAVWQGSNFIQLCLVSRNGSTLLINEVNIRRARLVLGWVTMSGFNSRCTGSISVCNQPPGSTQPGHPFVGRHNEYQPKGGDGWRLGSKGRYGLCVGGR